MILLTPPQAGPRADRYEWSDMASPYKWPEINGFAWGDISPYL